MPRNKRPNRGQPSPAARGGAAQAGGSPIRGSRGQASPPPSRGSSVSNVAVDRPLEPHDASIIRGQAERIAELERELAAAHRKQQQQAATITQFHDQLKEHERQASVSKWESKVQQKLILRREGELKNKSKAIKKME